MKLSNHEVPCLSGHFCIIKSLKICKSVIFPLAICILLMLEGCTLHKTKKGEQVDEQAIRRVIEQYVEKVRPGHFSFIEPSKEYADLIIPEGGHNERAMQVLVSFVKANCS